MNPPNQKKGRERSFNSYRIADGVGYIALLNREGDVGAEAMIDAADLPLLEELGLRWYRGQTARTCTYAMTRRRLEDGDRETMYLHRVLLQPEPGQMIDHINGNGLDNRRTNLRLATHAENSQNRDKAPNNTTGFKGVSVSGSRYAAVIRTNGKSVHIGTYDSPIEAARAYDEAAVLLHGKFARLNRPTGSRMPGLFEEAVPRHLFSHPQVVGSSNI